VLASAVQIKPWISLGSEKEVADLTVRPTRELAAAVLERPRRFFNREVMFTDKDSQEIHAMSSAHMELRPFKDSAFGGMRRLVHQTVQATVSSSSKLVQA
jgi:hypothetical protein